MYTSTKRSRSKTERSPKSTKSMELQGSEERQDHQATFCLRSSSSSRKRITSVSSLLALLQARGKKSHGHHQKETNGCEHPKDIQLLSKTSRPPCSPLLFLMFFGSSKASRETTSIAILLPTSCLLLSLVLIILSCLLLQSTLIFSSTA